MDEINELNLKILNLSLLIKQKNPELAKYMEEMTVTIPDQKHPNIDIESLTAYYNSLSLIWNNYLLSHPKV